MAEPSSHETGRSTPEILSGRDGVFWGSTMLFMGIVWFLEVIGAITLGDKFPEVVVPLLLVVGGLYLLAMKLGK